MNSGRAAEIDATGTQGHLPVVSLRHDIRGARDLAKSRARPPVRTAYAALAWVVVFFAFHVYWYLGGSFWLYGVLPSLAPDSVLGWIDEVLEAAVLLLGMWVCLAIARGWPRGRMRRVALVVVWLGCAVLFVRGAAGLIDDLTRAVGLLPTGLTGLTLKQTMGAAYYRSASALWSGDLIDAYFLVGGMIFGVLGFRYRHPLTGGQRRV
ncbi:hypothetical protein BH10ACT11_BH10ACT11_02470 [soil metagenome]